MLLSLRLANVGDFLSLQTRQLADLSEGGGSALRRGQGDGFLLLNRLTGLGIIALHPIAGRGQARDRQEDGGGDRPAAQGAEPCGWFESSAQQREWSAPPAR